VKHAPWRIDLRAAVAVLGVALVAIAIAVAGEAIMVLGEHRLFMAIGFAVLMIVLIVWHRYNTKS